MPSPRLVLLTAFIALCAICHAPPSAAADIELIIVDNTDPGFETTGTWDRSTVTPGFIGNDYLLASASGTKSNRIVDEKLASWAFATSDSTK